VDPIRYVALGDSYTIGTGLEDPAGAFPGLIAERLAEEIGIQVVLRNLGVNGYTTADLIRAELALAAKERPELVTVLIGANDIVQGAPQDSYRDRLTEIYEAIRRFGLPPERVIAISIPDFSALPGAVTFGTTDQLRFLIQAFNQVARSAAEARGFAFVDLTAISSKVDVRAGWLAEDNLHPGPAQQRAFADQTWETVARRWVLVQSDRWTDAAKMVVDTARTEAIASRAGYIGTEHLLLGLFTEMSVAALLSRHGLSDARIRRVIGRLYPPTDPRLDPSNPIPTTRCKRVLRIAATEAAAAGAQLVQPEHILRGLVIEGQGIAAQMLRDAGIGH
jgi:acyl-CoA thioesterase I